MLVSQKAKEFKSHLIKKWRNKPTWKTLNSTAGAVFTKTSAIIPFSAALLLYQGKLIEAIDSFVGTAVMWQSYSLIGQLCLVYGLVLIMVSHILFENDRPKHIVLANDEATYVRNELDSINKDQSNIDNYRYSMKNHILSDHPDLRNMDQLPRSKLEKAGIKQAAKLLGVLQRDEMHSLSTGTSLPQLTAGNLYDYYSYIIHTKPKSRQRINLLYKFGVCTASTSLLLPFIILPHAVAYYLIHKFV